MDLVTPQSSEAVDVLGVRVDVLTCRALIDDVKRRVLLRERSTILYANVHVLNQAYADAGLLDILRRADVVYCDGAGVVWGARLLGRTLPERMTGADWIDPFAAASAAAGLRLYLLGSAPGVPERAAEVLVGRYPGLQVVGAHHGYVQAADEVAVVVSDVNRAAPDVLLVGMGTPLQERWIAAHRAEIAAPVCWAVGALFDYVAGVVPRGPRWMLDHGLEWLWRLAVEPRRMAGRYVLGNPLFLCRVLAQRMRGGRSSIR